MSKRPTRYLRGYPIQTIEISGVDVQNLVVTDDMETSIDMPTWTMGSMLNKMMKDAGLNQQQLAEKADVSIGTLGKILREETKEPERPTLVKIASAFGISEVDLQVQLQRWNTVIEMPSLVSSSDAVFVDRRRPAEFSELTKEFARRYDRLTRPQRLAIDAVIFAFEESNEPERKS